MALLEVLVNDPPGEKCTQLMKNVKKFVSNHQEHDFRHYKQGSLVSKFLNIDSAPSILVNRKILLNGVASYEGIQKLIENSKPEEIGFVLTRSPGNNEYRVIEEILASPFGTFDSHNFFLLNDGVWVARTNSPIHITDTMQNVKFFCIDEYLSEAGIMKEELREGTEIINLGRFVDQIMVCDRTISL